MGKLPPHLQGRTIIIVKMEGYGVEPEQTDPAMILQFITFSSYLLCPVIFLHHCPLFIKSIIKIIFCLFNLRPLCHIKFELNKFVCFALLIYIS